MQVQGNRLYDSSLNEKIRKTLAGEDCSDGEGDAKKDKKDKREKNDKKDTRGKKDKKDRRYLLPLIKYVRLVANQFQKKTQGNVEKT